MRLTRSQHPPGGDLPTLFCGTNTIEAREEVYMLIWHNTVDASRIPEYVSAGQEVELWIGSYPIEGGQSVWLEITLYTEDGRELFCKMPAQWNSNNESRSNSYWVMNLGAFESGDRIEYRVYGSHEDELVSCNETFGFDVS